MDKQFQLFTIIAVVSRILPVDRRVKTLDVLIVLVHVLPRDLRRRNTVSKLCLWLVHTILYRLEEERVVARYWYYFVGEHNLGIVTGL